MKHSIPEIEKLLPSDLDFEGADDSAKAFKDMLRALCDEFKQEGFDNPLNNLAGFIMTGEPIYLQLYDDNLELKRMFLRMNRMDLLIAILKLAME